MANMILGSYTFDLDPAKVTGMDAADIMAPKATAESLTLTSHVLFQWAGTIVGQEIVLEWERMDSAMWEQLQTMAESTSSYEFDPQIGATTWDVIVTALEAQGRDPAGMSRVRLTLSVRGVHEEE